MWLINSPIGRKVVMSLTGICLILFLTFHCCMNVAAFFSGHAYNMVCEFLGSNWYAVLGTLGLAFLAVCHIVYAFILTAQNRRARGPQRYEVTSRRPEVSWASQNMLVLGFIVVLGLLLHLWNFWRNMMLAEFTNGGYAYDLSVKADKGADLIAYTFSNPVFTVLYIVWFVAIWFHMTHGFWSAFQTLGLNNKTWFCRWKTIGSVYVSLVMLIFLAVAVIFFIQGFFCAA